MRRALVLAALLVALLGVLAGAGAAAEPRASLPDIEDEVMCVQCGTALNVSGSAVADQERTFIRERIAEGLTKAQIKDALVEEYGPRVLGAPAADDGFGLAAYLVPLVLGALGVGVVALTAGRWRRARLLEPPLERSSAPAPLAPEDARRLDAELAAYDR